MEIDFESVRHLLHGGLWKARRILAEYADPDLVELEEQLGHIQSMISFLFDDETEVH